MDPTHGTAFQLNCDLLIFWHFDIFICSAFDCCRAHLRFWINLRVINDHIIIIHYRHITVRLKTVKSFESHCCVHSRWNQLDTAIVVLSIAGIILEEMKSGIIPINPTIIRVMRVLRIARGILQWQPRLLINISLCIITLQWQPRLLINMVI